MESIQSLPASEDGQGLASTSLPFLADVIAGGLLVTGCDSGGRERDMSTRSGGAAPAAGANHQGQAAGGQMALDSQLLENLEAHSPSDP
ncbi:hypothetical protein D623_10005661 [Myotis brandtii]|uniref:Uncharacterized protein n=1 Tax=Myotis brandtii TaxID=109478 RepID=S7P8M6_MYOBR|nr:hypothetical protein D623_10005661 [Myotis brandtii]